MIRSGSVVLSGWRLVSGMKTIRNILVIYLLLSGLVFIVATGLIAYDIRHGMHEKEQTFSLLAQRLYQQFDIVRQQAERGILSGDEAKQLAMRSIAPLTGADIRVDVYSAQGQLIGSSAAAGQADRQQPVHWRGQYPAWGWQLHLQSAPATGYGADGYVAFFSGMILVNFLLTLLLFYLLRAARAHDKPAVAPGTQGNDIRQLLTAEELDYLHRLNRSAEDDRHAVSLQKC